MAEFAANVTTQQQLQRLSEGVSGKFGFLGDHGAVTTNTGLQVNVAAIPAGGYIINDAVQQTAYTASTVTHGTADATNPRIDTIHINTSGTVAITAGTPAATPVPPDINATTQVEIAQVHIAANQTVLASSDITDRRQRLDNALLDLPTTMSRMMSANLRQAVCMNNGGEATNGASVGVGCTMVIGGTGTIAAASIMNGMRYTATASADDAGFYSQPLLTAGTDLTMMVRVVLNSTTNNDFFFGVSALPSAFSDANNRIGFRVVGTGNLVAFTDSAGTETVADSSFTPDGTTIKRLEMRINGGATTVQFYLDGAQVGSDVTTNIPSLAAMRSQIGITGTATNSGWFEYNDYISYLDV